MNIKKYLILGVGIATGVGVSIAGLSYASYNSSSSMRIITAQKAKDIMLGKVPGCTILEFSYDGDDRVPKYDGTVINGNYEYEIDVDAKTGAIIRFEQENIYNGNINNNTGENSNQITTKPSTSTSNSQATTKPSTSTTTNNNTAVQQKPVQQSQSSSSSYIGEARAKQIMLSKVPGATFRSFYLDYDDGRAEYEAELVQGNYEYDITVDARTGAIRDFSKDYIEKYDDDRYDDDRYDD